MIRDRHTVLTDSGTRLEPALDSNLESRVIVVLDELHLGEVVLQTRS